MATVDQSRLPRGSTQTIRHAAQTAFQVMQASSGTLLGALRSIWMHARPESAFEKAIAINSAVIVLVTAAGYWITQHNPETYHYVIDTAFIALAALLGVIVNFLLLRSSFRPLVRALEVVRAVGDGNLGARVPPSPTDADAQALASVFNRMLDQLERARDQAARQVLRAHEAERRQVALELHDQIGQSLTALALHAEVLSRRLTAAAVDPQTVERAARLGALVQDALREVQSLSRQLRPPLLDDAGLIAALKALTDDAHERLALDVRLDAQRAIPYGSASDLTSERPEARLSDELETALYRIAQESLTNATRHGHAHRAWIRLRHAKQDIRLLIVDDGEGFDPRAPTFHAGLGLAGMRERARLAGGTFHLRSHRGAGCAISIRVPVTSGQEASE